jgi:hypothetical protein
VAVRQSSWQQLASSQDPIAKNNAVFYAVSAVSFARECVSSVWSDVADSKLLVSRSFGWRLRFLALAFWLVSAILCSSLKEEIHEYFLKIKSFLVSQEKLLQNLLLKTPYRGTILKNRMAELFETTFRICVKFPSQWVYFVFSRIYMARNVLKRIFLWSRP